MQCANREAQPVLREPGVLVLGGAREHRAQARMLRADAQATVLKRIFFSSPVLVFLMTMFFIV